MRRRDFGPEWMVLPTNFVLSPFGCLVDGEFAIRPVWNHSLARLQMELGAIELNRDDGRFERHKVGNAADFGIGVRIRPCRKACIPDVVVATESFVRAEGSMFYSCQSGLIDVGTWNI